MFIITFQEPKLMSIYDITKKAMSSHRGIWYSDREVLGMILKFQNPEPMTSERKLSDEVCKCYKTFYRKYKIASVLDLKKHTSLTTTLTVKCFNICGTGGPLHLGKSKTS